MRALMLVVATVAAGLSGACGKSSSAAAPSPSPEPDGNPTTLQPIPPEPSPSPSPSPPDKSVDVDRLDSSAECDALLPASVPAPVTIQIDPSSGAGCGRGVSDGTGHVAVDQFTSRGTVWQVFGPDGGREQSFAITSDLWPQPGGWQGVQAATSGAAISISILTFFADGSPRRSEQPLATGFGPRAWSVAPDPHGGSIAVWWGPTDVGSTQTCLGEARRFDATGAPAGAPGGTGCDVAGVGVSIGGEALVTERVSGGAARLRWLRADGTTASVPAQDPSPPANQLLPLLDGSLVALQGSLFYTRRYPHLAPVSEPAPAWLAARTGQTFRFTRGNAGYAFFPPPGQQSSDCTQVVELLAPSGRRCVKLTFRRDGKACVTGSIDQGWDGTVVQQSSSGACGWRFWPRLLAGG